MTEGRRELSDQLMRAGAAPVEVEFIVIEPTADPAALEHAVGEWCAGAYAWMAVTSRNAILAMNKAATTVGLSLADPIPPARIAAVGDATRGVCEAMGLSVAMVPATPTAIGLAAHFPRGRGRVLVPVGNHASGALAAGLGRKGWNVTPVEAYRTVAGRGPTPRQVESLASGEVHAVLLTSGAMAARLAEACPVIHASTRMVAIGPTTAAATVAAGLKVHTVADGPTYEALIAAVVWSTGRIGT